MTRMMKKFQLVNLAGPAHIMTAGIPEKMSRLPHTVRHLCNTLRRSDSV